MYVWMEKLNTSVRIVIRLLLLALLGASCATVAGGMILVALRTLHGHRPSVQTVSGSLALGFFYGAPLGAVIAPTTALLLAHARIHRLVAVGFIGAVLGGVAGAILCRILDFGELALVVAVPAAVVGYAAAIWMAYQRSAL